VMEPGAAVPISVDDEAGILIFTLSGRGVMLLDGDRIEVGAKRGAHSAGRVVRDANTRRHRLDLRRAAGAGRVRRHPSSVIRSPWSADAVTDDGRRTTDDV